MFQVEVWIHVSAAGVVGWWRVLWRVVRSQRLRSRQSVAYLVVVQVVSQALGVFFVVLKVVPLVWHNR